MVTQKKTTFTHWQVGSGIARVPNKQKQSTPYGGLIQLIFLGHRLIFQIYLPGRYADTSQKICLLGQYDFATAKVVKYFRLSKYFG